MGMPFHQFIPAAILMDNPGITLEEFTHLLNQVNVKPYFSDQLLDYNKIPYLISDSFYSEIITNAVKIFRLNNDLSNLPEPPKEDRLKFSGLHVFPRCDDGKWQESGYRLVTYKGKLVRSPKSHKHIRSQGAELGDYIQLSNINQENLTHIIIEKDGKLFFQEDNKKPLFFVDEAGIQKVVLNGTRKQQGYFQDINISRVDPIYEVKEWSDYKSLVADHPEFALEQLVDLDQDSGVLYKKPTWWTPMKPEPIRWYKQGNKYYLDINDIIKHKQETEYTSIKLTSEAIRHKEWQVISYNLGYERAAIESDFFKRHPDIVTKHRNSVIQFWDLVEAQGMSVNEWLRLRALQPWRKGLTPEQAQKEYEFICEKNVKDIAEMEANTPECFKKKINGSSLNVDLNSDTPLF